MGRNGFVGSESVILYDFQFGCVGRILVLIVSVPGHCLIIDLTSDNIKGKW